MSKSILNIIPQQPTFIPEVLDMLLAGEFLLTIFPEADGTHSATFDEVHFIDAGENFENIICPACGAEISMDWWSEAMGTASETRFEILDVTVPCCNKHTTLNDLNYHLPQGFARSVLSVTNPDVSEIDEQTKSELEKILGSKLRFIFAHY